MAPVSFPESTKQKIVKRIEAFSNKAVIGRFVSCLALGQSFRDWIRTVIPVREKEVIVVLFGRGTFMLLLSSEQFASSLVARSPLQCGDKLLFLVKWYPGFDVATFGDRHRLPCTPVRVPFQSCLQSSSVRGLGAVCTALWHSFSVFYSASVFVSFYQSGSVSFH